MPWEDIINSLLKTKERMGDTTKAEELGLPHDEETLAQMVRFHIKINNLEESVHLKQAKLRPTIVLALLKELIDRRHPAFSKWEDPDRCYQAMGRAVCAKFPWAYHRGANGQWSAKEDGEVPPMVLKAMLGRGAEDTAADSLLTEKNEIPPDASKSLDEALEDIRPKAFLEERSSKNVEDPNV